jgi:hypothetical protein
MGNGETGHRVQLTARHIRKLVGFAAPIASGALKADHELPVKAFLHQHAGEVNVYGALDVPIPVRGNTRNRRREQGEGYYKYQ